MKYRSASKIIYLILFVVSVGQAAPAPALPIKVGFGHDFPNEFEQQVLPIVESAIHFVATFPPKKLSNHLFDWQRSRMILRGKTFVISITDSRTPITEFLKLGPGGIPKDLDAVTVIPINFTQRSLQIHTLLFVDKIFYLNGAERPDSFARLVIALAHEIYGNVQRYLFHDILESKPMDLEMRARAEVEAFSTSIRFLEDLKKDPKFATLPPKIAQDLMNQLSRERAGLESWNRALLKCQGRL
jgi:hypothetical protein